MQQNNVEDLLIDLGKELHRIRHEKEEKIETVAKAVGVTHPVISRIEHGTYKGLTVKLLMDISKYYGVDIYDVIKR